ncbi:uncharacterized protein LOC123648164 [Lemur catta]|uniref:uncharacterized protein LOC123648164 n=1 Tax=Lemur catta TaxID=9447 RepID=UPI001E26A977|nr:uncharacterized protein LOC123648164 [Lemur catta]
MPREGKEIYAVPGELSRRARTPRQKDSLSICVPKSAQVEKNEPLSQPYVQERKALASPFVVSFPLQNLRRRSKGLQNLERKEPCLRKAQRRLLASPLECTRRSGSSLQLSGRTRMARGSSRFWRSEHAILGVPKRDAITNAIGATCRDGRGAGARRAEVVQPRLLGMGLGAARAGGPNAPPLPAAPGLTSRHVGWSFSSPPETGVTS